MFALFRNVVRFARLCWRSSSPSAASRCIPPTIAVSRRARTASIRYQARVPLGWESFKVRSSGICFYLLGTVESPKFDGWQKVTVKDRSHLYDASGQPVRVYPEEMQFRITASAREKLLENQPFTIASAIPMNDYLLHLRFRLKVFHGVEWRIVRPASVEAIGMPAEVSYDERIYRIRFNLGRIPIDDRIVLEVFSPTGERLSKFHVDLF